jgi:hypothetical protein
VEWQPISEKKKKESRKCGGPPSQDFAIQKTHITIEYRLEDIRLPDGLY